MFSEREINAANSVGIKELVSSLGYKPKKIGNNEYKIEGYGGLFFNTEQNKWYCFKDSEGGGVVQFLIRVENKSWKDSVKYLLDGFINASGYDHKDINYRETEKRSVKYNKESEHEDKKTKITLPPKADRYKRLYAYLIKTRKIGKQVVDFFVKRGEIYENDKGGMVFTGKDKGGEIRYAMIRGTSENKPFKAEVKNSDKSYSFNVANVRSDKLVVFESAIDLMSYVTIKTELDNKYLLNTENLISLGGIGDKALKRMLTDNQNIKSIEFALDNDEAGETARNRFVREYENGFTLSRLIFKGKDINEHLKRLVEENFIVGALQEETLNEAYDITGEEYET